MFVTSVAVYLEYYVVYIGPEITARYEDTDLSLHRFAFIIFLLHS